MFTLSEWEVYLDLLKSVYILTQLLTLASYNKLNSQKKLKDDTRWFNPCVPLYYIKKRKTLVPLGRIHIAMKGYLPNSIEKGKLQFDIDHSHIDIVGPTFYVNNGDVT